MDLVLDGSTPEGDTMVWVGAGVVWCVCVKRFAARCKLRRGGPWRLWCADFKSGERRSLIFNGSKSHKQM